MESKVFSLNECLRDKEAEHNKAVAEVMENAKVMGEVKAQL